MELKDFVAATLTQIVEGVKIAQAGEDGLNINAGMAGATFGGSLVNVGSYGVATRVDFDVAVTADTKGGAGAKLSVFGFGVEGGGEHSVGSANRISFSVPVRLPDGDKAREANVKAQQNARRSESLRKLKQLNR